MALPDYMLPMEGETEEEMQERLFREWLYARGGNKPEDVNRWLETYPPEMFATMYMETWGSYVDEEDYTDATEEDLANPDVEIFEEVV